MAAGKERSRNATDSEMFGNSEKERDRKPNGDKTIINQGVKYIDRLI
jgi:hypothetical protein